MKMQKIGALVGVELKKLYRDPMSLAVILAMPVVLTLIFYFAMRDLPTWWLEGASHFEFLVPGTMGFAVIYMGMLVAMALCTYREAGLLKRLESTPTSPYEYMGSLIIAYMVIGVFQGLVVLLLSVILGFRPQGGLPGLVMTGIFLGLLAITAVGLGLLTATVAKSSSAASGLSMIFIIPMMVFGTFLAAFSEMTISIARFTPNFYVTESLTRIFHGASMSDRIMWQNLLILAIISLVAVVAGIQLFKRTEFR
jgi:ABC-2 type transport system permease protein